MKKAQTADKARVISEGVLPRGGSVMSFDGKKVIFRTVPVFWQIVKPTKKQGREIMKQAREGLGLARAGK